MKYKRIPHVRLGPVTKGVLGIVAISGFIPLMAIAPGLTVVMVPFLKKKKYQPEQIINRNISSLLKKGLLKQTVNSKGEMIITLTSRGKWEAGIRRLDIQEKTTQQKWDGLWRVIIFDIPEHKSTIRRELRRAVSLFGFHQLQKSVWVYPYPCDDFVQLVKSHLGISSDVLYMTVNYLENSKYLKQEFKL